MADEKLNTGPAENISPEAAEPIITPEQAAASEPQQEQTGPAIPEPGDVVVSFDKINELMAEKRQNARAEVEKAEPPETPEAAAPGETPQPANTEEPKKPRRGRPPKAEKAATENQKSEKSAGARKGRPPKADKTAPDKPKPSKRDKVSRSDGKAPDAKEPVKPTQDTSPKETATAEQTTPEPTTPPRPVEEGKLVYLKLSEVHPFHTFRPHPFKVRDDAKMQEIVASIRVNGVMVPGLARPEKDGNGYEIVAGHRRTHGSELAGLEEMPFIVREMTDHEAVQAMKDSNKQRDGMLPSELAALLELEVEDIKHQGGRLKGVAEGDVGKRSVEIVGEAHEMNYKKVMRYLRLIGIVVIWVLCAILRFLSPEFFKAMPTFGFSVPSILAGIVVGLVTVLFAAYSPAKKAAKVSPLAAVSGNANDLEPARNAANTQLLKIDTALGIYHAKANRKNLFLMTSSFALSIILFLSFSVTVEFMQHTLTPLQPWTADLSIISPDNACAIDKALLDDLKENPVVDLAYGRKFAYEVPSVTNGIEKKMDLISYEQYQFDWAKDYLLEGSLESVQTDLGTGLIVYNSQNTIQIGDTVSLNTNGQSKEIQIVGMLSDCPFYSAAGVGTIICSEDTFEQITGESKYTVIDVQLVKGTTDEDVYVIRQMVDSSFTFADERMGNSSTMGTYYCFWLFIYGFLVLIAMITIFNIINSISMSVSARLKQYGAFRAIGVSMGQLSKMIVAEAFTYTIIGGVVGTVLGLFCNKLLFGMLISYRWGDAWTPPLPEVAVILLIVVSSVILAVHGPIKRIRNMSIVDTISAQ